jgi:CRISPR type III-A-associated RAMP protein Csm4
MNPGLVVKLRPAGPWRIGPDSGARNRTDVIYHSDSLYSAVTSAMLRLGSLEDWLDATARNAAPAVCFSSCFPFQDEIGFVIPPRTLWPPSSPALLSARVRWKSARFVPLAVVQAIAHGQPPDENDWSIDGPSECLVPAGSHGPFLAGVRWSAAVDRLTGSVERHSTACIEFQPGAGLWTIVSFADEAARARWLEPVKAAFRLLADSGFGGERSRGWGRSDTPEFIEGTLPDMILGAKPAAPVAPAAPAVPAEEAPAPPAAESLAAAQRDVPILAPLAVPEAPPSESELAAPPDASAETAKPPLPEPVPVSLEAPPEAEFPLPEPVPPSPDASAETAEPRLPDPDPVPVSLEPSPQAEPAVPEPAPVSPEPPLEAESPVPAPHPEGPRPAPVYWLLSLFTPGAADTVDWRRGNYALTARGGRVESPAGSGELKKQIQMVAEGSVLHAASEPRGSASNVAPDGFAHPVFRAGFAVSIPLPEVS